MSDALVFAKQFRKRFLGLILTGWVVPAVFGLTFLVLIEMFTPQQMVHIIASPTEALFILANILFAYWFFKRFSLPLYDFLAAPGTVAPEAILNRIQRFPLLFWSVLLVYLAVAPSSVILSAEWFAGYEARPIDWFRIHLVALIVSIIVGLPIFFIVYDLFGRAFGNLYTAKPHVTIKVKVFLIGSLVPLLIDTMLVQYYWTRTGYFTLETFVIWLFLEVLAIFGSIIFVRSFGQSIGPLERFLEARAPFEGQISRQLQPLATDELGVLTVRFRDLLEDRKNIERNLFESRETFKTLVEFTDAIHWELDISTYRFMYVSPQIQKLLGFPPEHWATLDDWTATLYPDDREWAREYCLTEALEGRDHEFAYRVLASDGRIVWLRDIVKVLSGDGQPRKLVGIMFDITNQKGAEDKLHALLQEKDMLLKEIHHRVKNNMQIVSSLANLQSRFVHDNESKQVFFESRNRIQAMALVHETLYRSDDLSSVNLKEYYTRLLKHLFDSLGGEIKGITYRLDIDDIAISPDILIPCALIVTELFSNTMKYAFVGRESGEIAVSLKYRHAGICELSVWDNGVGLPDGLNIENTETLGFLLVSSLAKQIKGTVGIDDSNPGTRISITFNIDAGQS